MNHFISTMSSIVNKIKNNDYALLSQKSRRKFTPQEDEILKFLISQYGSSDWIQISKLMPGRNPKQCRDRFYNYLSETQRKEPWDRDEDDMLLTLLSIIGAKWVEIARHIPGRSGNDVKNRWYKHLSKEHQDIIIPNSKEKNQYKTKKSLKSNDSCNFSENNQNVLGKYSISSLLI